MKWCLIVVLIYTSLMTFFWPCWILAPLPEMDPGPLEVKAQSPNHWTARKFSLMITDKYLFMCLLIICASLKFFILYWSIVD